MPVDYTQFTDFYRVEKDGAVLREYPEPDALALVALKRGQILRRLDAVNWNGAWLRFYADVVGGRKYEGYLYFEEVAQTDAPAAEPQPGPSPPPPPVTPPPAPPASPPAGGVTMITLGCVDPNITEAQCAAYMQAVQRTTRLRPDRTAAGEDMILIKPLPPQSGLMSIAEVQQALKTIGFFPGGETDGIYGYRTRAAIRLFQEYVRAVEGQRIVPDGRFGPVTQTHLKRWIDTGVRPDWKPRSGEYEAWARLLGAAKAKYAATPGPILEQVNVFQGRSATRKVADWDVSPDDGVHLIGIRREDFRTRDGKTQSDDIFVLLVRGLVFKFQGSTDPGAAGNAAGAAFLTTGQHDYLFGWHDAGSQLALEPKAPGVLIVRSKGDLKLSDEDIARGVSVNPDINIHWGGIGAERTLNNWSHGCQVIGGAFYIDPADQLRDCRPYAALNKGQLGATMTRGAYNVLSDLVTALSGDLPDPGLVRYTLVENVDLDLVPGLAQVAENARTRVLEKLRIRA